MPTVIIGMGVIPPEAEEDTYREVPASDRGNEGYGDRGMMGTYQTSRRAFRDPDGVAHYSGYGCTEAEYERGYAKPELREDPDYDFKSRKQRGVNKGFIPRPLYGTERN